jgi:hypothetical protein
MERYPQSFSSRSTFFVLKHVLPPSIPIAHILVRRIKTQFITNGIQDKHSSCNAKLGGSNFSNLAYIIRVQPKWFGVSGRPVTIT